MIPSHGLDSPQQRGTNILSYQWQQTLILPGEGNFERLSGREQTSLILFHYDIQINLCPQPTPLLSRQIALIEFSWESSNCWEIYSKVWRDRGLGKLKRNIFHWITAWLELQRNISLSHVEWRGEILDNSSEVLSDNFTLRRIIAFVISISTRSIFKFIFPGPDLCCFSRYSIKERSWLNFLFYSSNFYVFLTGSGELRKARKQNLLRREIPMLALS